MSKPKIQLESGTCGESKVWIGVPDSCYDEVARRLSNDTTHALIFTVCQAKAVIEMLQTEIDRVEGGVK